MIRIIEDNQDFIVVSKPDGIGFHQDDNDNSGLFAILKDQLQIPLFSVHRLDKVTSGLLIIAKNQNAASLFGKLFCDHQIEKYYLAIAGNRPKKKQGLVKGDISKSRRGAWKLEHTTKNPSITHFFSFTLEPGLRIYILKPKTGKTHQLRVIMKSLGSPILGDTLYSGDSSDRVYLHAYYLSFEFKQKSYSFFDMPVSGEFFIKKTDKLMKFSNPTTLKWPIT